MTADEQGGFVTTATIPRDVEPREYLITDCPQSWSWNAGMLLVFAADPTTAAVSTDPTAMISQSVVAVTAAESTLAAEVVSQPVAASTAEDGPNLSYTGFPTEPRRAPSARSLSVDCALSAAG